MSNERKQVLDLLAEGKISSEDAERLLDRLAGSASTGDAGASSAGSSTAAPSGSGQPPTAAPKFMCVHVDSHEGDQVNVRLPLALVRSGIKLSAFLPREAAETMSKNGVDFSQLSGLSGDDLIEALRHMQVDVVSHEGDQVKVYCE